MDLRRPLIVLVTALMAASAGAAGTDAPQPVLTYAVYPPGNVHGGLCATDLQGHRFRVTDPHDIRDAQWSPDGRSIAFTRWDGIRGFEHGTDVFVTDAEGRHARNLTGGGSRRSFYLAAWSPDSRRLLINHIDGLGGSNLYAVNGDGSERRPLISVGYPILVGAGSWSRDGKILFSMRTADWAVYVIDADAGRERKLIDSAAGATWSPDGSRFAYGARRNGRSAGFGVANADGSEAHLLVEGSVGAPIWSPDGRQLAYIAESDSGQVPHAIEVVEVETGSVRRIATGNFADALAWSPDGTSIAFTRNDRVKKIVLSTPDGARQTPVDTDGLPASNPAWRLPGPLPSDRRPCVVHGTARADAIRGTDRGDLVYGGAGDDRIRGNGGDDVLVGGRGHDQLDGGRGDDRFRAYDFTRDFLSGGPGVDRGHFDSVDVVRSVFRSSR